MKYGIPYADILSMWMKFINPIAPGKETRIKNNTEKGFDKEIAELTHAKVYVNQKIYKNKLSTKFKTY